MNDTDILAAWDEGAPPSRTAAFRIATLQRLEQRRFAGRMVLLLAIGAAMIAALLVLAPEVELAAKGLPADTALFALAGLAIAAAVWGLSRAFRIRLV